jgi:hypothetical protein
MVAFPLVHVSWSLPRNKRKPCDAFFGDLFGARSIYELCITPDNANLGYDREESLLLIADSLLIPVAPGGGGLTDGSPIGDMLRRSAKPGMWLGIAFRVSDLDAATSWLRIRGIEPHYDAGAQGHYCMIRRKEALGIRIEFMTAQLPGDPRSLSGWNANWWRDCHPLGIEGLQSIGVSVERLEDARDVFGSKWEWREISQRYLAVDQANSIGFLMGDCIVEAMQASDITSRLARHASEIKGIYCLTYKVKSAAAAMAYLKGKGVSVIGDAMTRFAIEPSESFDRLIYFTEEVVVGYPAMGEFRPTVAPPLFKWCE